MARNPLCEVTLHYTGPLDPEEAAADTGVGHGECGEGDGGERRLHCRL